MKHVICRLKYIQVKYIKWELISGGLVLTLILQLTTGGWF